MRENLTKEEAGHADPKVQSRADCDLAAANRSADGKREDGIHTQTYYRWRKEYGGLKLDQAKRLKELEKENTRLKRLVAELSLEKQVLRDVARGNF